MNVKRHTIILLIVASLVGGALLWDAINRSRGIRISGGIFGARQQAALSRNIITDSAGGGEATLPETGTETPISDLLRGKLADPIDAFQGRITKKPFGVFITPETSPIENDRFSGYHTGVDVEYGDVFENVSVQAVAGGTVRAAAFVPGYGGVAVIRHRVDETVFLALYGHLDPARLPQTGAEVRKGQDIGILGDQSPEETDGARKHLHFAILKKDDLDFRGYVKEKEELAGWYNPLDFYITAP